jgi:hypothetical protein
MHEFARQTQHTVASNKVCSTRNSHLHDFPSFGTVVGIEISLILRVDTAYCTVKKHVTVQNGAVADSAKYSITNAGLIWPFTHRHILGIYYVQ